MSELVTQHCALLEQWKSTDQFNQDRDDILNDLHRELIRLQSSHVSIFREEINKVTGLLRENILNLNQLILAFFVDYFIQLLKQWRKENSLNDDTLENLESIITKHSDILMNDLLVTEFLQCLEAIANTGKDLFTSPKIPVITQVLMAYTNIQSQYNMSFMGKSEFDDGVIKCLCSPYTIDVFTQLKSSVNSSERSLTEEFVFDGLFGYIRFINRERLEERSLLLREHLLASVSDLLDVFLISANEWSTSAITILTDVTTDFLYAVQMTIPNDTNLLIQKHICDTAVRSLLLPTYQSMKLNNNCLQYIYMGTLNDKILDHLKAQKLTPSMFEIAGFYKDDAEIQFNIYRILAAIMTEEDIKRLDDPGVIAKVFLDHLVEIRNRPGWETRLKNLLTSLKILLQHDQIRDEIYKQDGVKLFICCGTTARYETLIQQRALENLLIMSFKDEVCQMLKDNVTFMAHIKAVSENSTDLDLQRAANGLLWILTKDQTSIASVDDNSPSKTVYDIMISYSHKDKDLCFQLYDRLVKDNFRVWLDRDQMHGTPLEAMSDGIENSEFVFVCMSDAYKQSGYCKMEAYYALERQCCIIPIVMKAQYKADGWLGIIVTGKMRIDFPKYGFKDAYDKVITEIARNRKEKQQGSLLHHHEAPSISDPSNETPMNVEKVTYQPKPDHRLPSNIEQWTVDDVQQFFIKQHLQSFLPICTRMNGTRLVGLYQMCTTNSPVMFQSLNHQLTVMKNTERRHHLIDIYEYLQFLDDLKPLVPVIPEKKEVTVPQSSACGIL